jgi:hypothetical protein
MCMNPGNDHNCSCLWLILIAVVVLCCCGGSFNLCGGDHSCC